MKKLYAFITLCIAYASAHGMDSAESKNLDNWIEQVKNADNEQKELVYTVIAKESTMMQKTAAIIEDTLDWEKYKKIKTTIFFADIPVDPKIKNLINEYVALTNYDSLTREELMILDKHALTYKRLKSEEGEDIAKKFAQEDFTNIARILQKQIKATCDDHKLIYTKFAEFDPELWEQKEQEAKKLF